MNRLVKWRGHNVVLTDAWGHAVLGLDARGNLVEKSGEAREENPIEPHSLEELARSVACWIEWSCDEPHQFRACDIHPQIRDQVVRLAPRCVDQLMSCSLTLHNLA